MSYLIFHENATPMVGVEFEYLNTFNKGKRSEVYRHHFREVYTGKEFLFYMRNDRLESLQIGNVGDKDAEAVKISDEHFKSTYNNYNYYLKGYKPELVHKMFEDWRKLNPMVVYDGMIWRFISDIPNYTGRYKFEDKKY